MSDEVREWISYLRDIGVRELHVSRTRVAGAQGIPAGSRPADPAAHYMIFSIMLEDFGLDRWLVNTAGILFTFAAALLSYQLIERPALRLKTRFAAG